MINLKLRAYNAAGEEVSGQDVQDAVRYVYVDSFTGAEMGGFSSGAVGGQDHRLIKKTIILAGTTTYTPPPGISAINVECIGAGASGGSGLTGTTSTSAGSGGGGGGYSSVFLETVKSTYACVVGAGGAAPTAGDHAGNNGNDTTFDSPSVCTAKGGTGGASGGTAATTLLYLAGGAGGAASSGVGDLKLNGGDGRESRRASATDAVGGGGGFAPNSGTGAPDVVAQGAGTAGRVYGGGGSGGLSLNGGASVAGGAGADGLIIISEYA